ncbi:histidine phosphatase superfamily [Kockiozyma suomiensis]|uniref:histidine phosphatase superfamily n=1 Tax=Kockiozyma suomiensis TaxID=1337062 RepID=UPI003343AF38
MPLERIYLTRHGFRSNWVEDVPIPAPVTGIDGDFLLSAHGEEQAVQLAKQLALAEPKIDKIYCSPFYRCLQTVEELSNKLDIEILPENGVGEWYGVTRATHPVPASPEILKNFFPKVKKDYQPILVPSKSGETKDELHQRAAKTLSEIINIANKENTRAILICSHAATLIAIGRALTGNPAFEVRTGVCTIGEYTAEGDDNGVGKWKCVRNGEATHLTNGEERHWDFDSGNYDFLDAQAQKKDVV